MTLKERERDTGKMRGRERGTKKMRDRERRTERQGGPEAAWRAHGCLFDPGGVGAGRHNFGGLVLGGIDADVCKSRFI